MRPAPSSERPRPAEPVRAGPGREPGIDPGRGPGPGLGTDPVPVHRPNTEPATAAPQAAPPGLRFDGRNASLSDRVYARIVETILAGELGSAGRLPTESVLAERFGVSRPTVREALMRLRADGIVASRRGAGSWVVRAPSSPASEPPPIRSMADVERYYAFRICLESGAAAAAATLRTTADLAAIEAALAALESAGEAGRPTVDEDVRFHLAIARASHNPFFVAAIEHGIAPVRQFMELARNVAAPSSDVVDDTVDPEHRAIVDAIARGAADAAADSMRAHLVAAHRRILEGTPVR